MFRYAMLAIGSFMCLLLLFFTYISKPRYSSTENRLYKVVLISLLWCIGFEIISYITMYYRDSIPIVNEIVCKLAYFFAIFYIVSKESYFLSLGCNYKVDKLIDLVKVDKKFKITFIILIIVLIIFLFLPFEYHTVNGAAFLTGPAYYFVFLYGSIFTTVVLIIILINKNNLSFDKRSQVFFIFLVSVITLPLQLVFPYLSIATSGFCIDLYFLYFSLENPDLLLMKEVEEAKVKADISSNAKLDFLSNMSHEIRSPMNAIIGFSESILNNNEFNDEDIKKDISNIKNAGNSLIDIINNILNISKIENGKESLNESEYSIKDICLELINIIETRIGNKKIKLIFEIDEKLPSTIYGDRTKVYQILLNILTNAVKYTEVGKIFLRINGEIINDKVNLFLSVEDTGYGIKKEDYDKIFNKFVRLDSATENEIEGTGLGLVITKKMVNLLGGTIKFNSEYEVGTTFEVNIKQKIIDYTPLGKINNSKNKIKNNDLIDCSNYTVLVVDDNKLNLKAIERLLQHYKFNITLVNSSSECIYKIKEGKKFDIIFLDHYMSDIDGIETLHILRNLDSFDIPPIVVISANATTGMKEFYIKEGFDDYLAKPINSEELNRIINKYFKEDKDV